MEIREQEAILSELIKMNPSLEDASFNEQYDLCYRTYNALPGHPKDWTLQQFIDPVTFEPKWLWRKKS